MKKSIIITAVLLVIIGLVFNKLGTKRPHLLYIMQRNNTDQIQPLDNKNMAGLANPASVNCTTQGGTLEMRNRKIGAYGVCMFEDNRQCEEWALFRGECPKGGIKITGYDNEAEIYCAITGGQVEGIDTPTPMCKRIDGTLCTAQANFDGDCPDPHDPNPSAGNVETP